ncbi:FtsB family cell division protein [Alloiococcus sp. CFN-8]|uniref:FtsB family cell division protein n=1 Tax=Alloiococcus sp. CFN-8 TaxID=3416081 RepID=UPI003CF6A45C
MKKNKRIKNVIIGFMLVVLAYNVINQQIAMKRIEKEFSEKKEELQLLKIENERLTEEVEASETDPSYMERLAREKLGLVKPGEVTIIDSQSDSQ